MKSERKSNYHKYLKSDWWKEIKKKKLKRFCCICNNSKYLLLHHFSYKDIYKPTIKKASRDTVTVCFGCHNIIHTVQKERKLTYEQTRGVVRELRNDWLKACRINRWYEEQLANRVRYD